MMEVAGPWTEVFEGSERSEKSGRADALLGSSTLTLAPLVADSPSIRRSQPIFIASNRAKGVESFSSSVPSIPNPFPELCSPSKSPVLISSLPPQSSDKHLRVPTSEFVLSKEKSFPPPPLDQILNSFH